MLAVLVAGIGEPAPVLEALEYMRSSGWKGRYLPEDAPLVAVAKGWEHMLFTGDASGDADGSADGNVSGNGKIERKAYSLGVVEALHDGLKRRDVYVAPSERWADPRAKLLSGEEWEAARPQVLRTLELPANPGEYVKELEEILELHARTEHELQAASKLSVLKPRYRTPGRGVRQEERTLVHPPCDVLRRWWEASPVDIYNTKKLQDKWGTSKIWKSGSLL